MPHYTVSLDKAPQHTVDVTLASDDNREAYQTALQRFAKDNGFKYVTEAGDSNANVLLIMLKSKSTDIISISSFNRDIFNTSVYSNSQNREDKENTNLIFDNLRKFLINQNYINQNIKF
jgi:hypothetical protein